MAEPSKLISGYSDEWTRTLTDYPTSTHTLKYVFRRVDGTGFAQTFTAVADGVATHKLTLTPAQAATLTVGAYSLLGYVIDDATSGATTKATVYDGVVQIEPDPAASTSEDRRTHARRMVDLLRAGLEKLAKGTTSSVSIQGKTFTMRSIGELRGELNRYEERVRQEEDAARTGTRGRNNIYVRFNPTS
jgi:hypothetical protein